MTEAGYTGWWIGEPDPIARPEPATPRPPAARHPGLALAGATPLMVLPEPAR